MMIMHALQGVKPRHDRVQFEIVVDDADHRCCEK
jgi:hypothetical protein